MDWEKEIDKQFARLDTIGTLPVPKHFPTLEEAEEVFVTGTTGYLGAFLLHELCSKNIKKINCLVRSSSKEAGSCRIKDNMKKYGLWGQDFDKYIFPITGDLTQAKLGINDDEWSSLSKNVQIVFHLGAIVNYALSYSDIETTTVGGTLEIINFCSSGQIKPLHFVSTNAVFPLKTPAGLPSFCEEKQLPKIATGNIHPCAQLADGYSQSKYVAEVLVGEAQNRLKIPCIIYRPGWIGPSFQTGASNPLDLLAWIVALCIFIKSAPMNGGGCEEWRLESFPVDILAKVICGAENTHGSSTPLIIHAINGHPVLATSVWQDLNKAGHVPDLVSNQEWRDRIAAKGKELAESDQKRISKEALDELQAFLPMLDEYAHWLVDHKTYEQTGVTKVLEKLKIDYPTMTAPVFIRQVNFLKQGSVFNLCGFCGV